MSDINEIQAAQTVKIVGSDATGVESTPVASNSAGEILSNDTPNQTGVNATLSLTTTPVLVKVGASPLTNRKYVIIQATSTNVKWGNDTNCLFDCFKNQLIFIPAGAACAIYIKAATGTASSIIGEE